MEPHYTYCWLTAMAIIAPGLQTYLILHLGPNLCYRYWLKSQGVHLRRKSRIFLDSLKYSRTYSLSQTIFPHPGDVKTFLLETKE